jgi:hypothetical protein
MTHLRLEAIARIADETPTAEEAAHLEMCEHCRRELDEMREDIHTLSLLPDVAPVPEAWGALERRLADEGLLRAPSKYSFSTGTMRIMQIAATLLVFVGGSVLGRMTARPAAQDNGSVATSSQQTTSSLQATSNPNVRLASSGSLEMPRTVEEAAAQLRATEEPYFNALTRYAELATGSQVGDPVARLAALQSIVNTTAAALSQAPADPVVNGYHLTALAQRDAALKQVAATTGERWY